MSLERFHRRVLKNYVENFSENQGLKMLKLLEGLLMVESMVMEP